jgi:hypothetical protein
MADGSAPVGAATPARLRHTARRTARGRPAGGVATGAGDAVPVWRRSPTGAWGAGDPTAARQPPANGPAVRGRCAGTRVAPHAGHSPAGGDSLAGGGTAGERPIGTGGAPAAGHFASRGAAAAARGDPVVRSRAADRDLAITGIVATGGSLVRFLVGTAGELAAAWLATGARDSVPRRGTRRNGAPAAATDQ